MTTKQHRFDFDAPAAPRVVPVRDKTVAAEEKPRLQSQSEVILDLLRKGDASNDELSRISRKYTSRISDLRAAGHDIRAISHDRISGVVVYRLVKEKTE